MPRAMILLFGLLQTACVCIHFDPTGTRFRCDDGQCPSGFSCREAVCVALDGGVLNCGNGRLDANEECDDGNRIDVDACRNSCRWARCGDGVVRTNVEECDDSNTADNDACSSSCLKCDQGEARLVYEGHCYSRHLELADFEGAKANICALQGLGGHLVTYSDREEAVGVSPLIKDRPYWLGFFNNCCGFYWYTFEAGSYSSWAAGAPSDAGICVEQRPSGTGGVEWKDVPCESARATLCEQDGWFFDGETNHAYRVFHDLKSWPQAKAACEALGAHLVTVSGQREEALLASKGHATAWLGLSDLSGDGGFKWVTGEPATFTYWDVNQPTLSGQPSCVLQWPKWANVSCLGARPYVCEMD